MSQPSATTPRRLRRLSVVIFTLVVAVPLTVIASDRFTDVPDSNTFHGFITWLADNEVTLGCNPPTNDEFCPGDNVTREQMAAFMRRLAQTFGNTGAQVNEVGDTVAVDSTSGVEVLSIDVAPKDAVNVSLNAHVVIAVGQAQDGAYEIHRDTCAGDLISRGTWIIEAPTAVINVETYALTGFDTVSTDTTYVLCVSQSSGAFNPAAAGQRALTASWSPDA